MTQAELPLREPAHACLRTIIALAAEVGAERLSRGCLRRRFARGSGFGPGFLLRGYGVTGIGASWSEAAAAWLYGAKAGANGQ